MTPLDYALAYASRGWPVFPVHTPTLSGCSCRSPRCDRPGKHPRIGTGRNGASLDPEVIARWWAQWPDANIGIATGVESGLLVLDIDDTDADIPPLPDTVESITGSGGRHVIYQRPDDGAKYRTRVRFRPGMDTRADGGYIIAPPSLHASGRRYEWEGSSDPFEGVAPSPAPDWLLAETRSDPAPDSMTSPPTWDPDGELPESIVDMLSAIPADDYDVWRDVGMALHYTDPVNGLGVWDWWAGTSAKYDAAAVRREWANFSRRGHAVANPLTIDSVRRMADQHGWVDPDIEVGRIAAESMLRSRQAQIAQQMRAGAQIDSIEAPSTLMPAEGLIRDIAQHILATSIRPQPVLAVMAATSLVGALAGRKYRTETDLRTNLYIVALAESGAGKDHARKVISKLAAYAEADHYLGGDRIASGPGVVSALVRHPSQLFMLDEIGMMLASMTGAKSDPHKRELMATLMTLYSSAGSVYRGTEYADQSQRPRQTISNPNVCIYGTSTPSAFWGALTGSQGVDGTLSRLIVATADSHRPPRQRPMAGAMPGALIDGVKALAQHETGGNLAGMAGGRTDREPQTAPMAAGVFEAWEALDDAMDEHMTDDASRSVYSRVPENAAKLALTYAVSVDYRAPRITPEAFAWGRELALWAANSMMREARRHVADNDVAAQRQRVMAMIRDAGADGITRREILRRSKTLRKREADELLSLLVESGEAVSDSRPGKSGPARIVFLAIDEG
jgi:hypothetical protein